jgi:glycosyltransferase involved in cell wall biosynthesis
VDEIANKIIAVLRYPPLVAEMIDKTRDELRSIRWEYAAEKIVEAYRQVLR